MKLKRLEKILKKIDKGYYALGEYNYKSYSININDFEDEIDKKYIMNLCTLRGIILRSFYFDEATEVVHHLNNVKMKVEKDNW